MRVLTKVPHYVQNKHLKEELPQKLLSFDTIIVSENILLVTNVGDKEVVDFLNENIINKISELDYESICMLCYFNQEKINDAVKKIEQAVVIRLKDQLYKAISPDVMIEVDARRQMQVAYVNRLEELGGSEKPVEEKDYYKEHRQALSLEKTKRN